MKFRGGEFSTGTMGNFQPELTCGGGRWNKFRIADHRWVLRRANFKIDFQLRIGLTSYWSRRGLGCVEVKGCTRNELASRCGICDGSR
jgi:hypothetical protein